VKSLAHAHVGRLDLDRVEFGEAGMVLVEDRGLPVRHDGQVGALEVREAGAGAPLQVGRGLPHRHQDRTCGQ
jgi:hypothetical protein